MTEIRPKQNKVCFQKKFDRKLILPQNVSDGDIVGYGNCGGDGGRVVVLVLVVMVVVFVMMVMWW